MIVKSRRHPVPQANQAHEENTGEVLQHSERVAVGIIRDAWGLGGAFKIEPFNHPHDSVLKSVRRWWLRAAPRAGHSSGEAGAGAGGGLASVPSPGVAHAPQSLRISRCRVHGETLVAQAEGIGDRTSAEALKGLLVEIDRADFPRTTAGEYYWIDLIGCAVMGQGGAVLGEVVALDDHGAHAILIVKKDGDERLIPFVETYLVSVDISKRRIEVDWHPDW